jgi:hypothetical protein
VALEAALDQAPPAPVDPSNATPIGNKLQFRNHVLYAPQRVCIKARSEMEIMLPLPLSMRGKTGVLLVDRLPERPGFDTTLTAASLSEIVGDRIKVRLINPDHSDTYVRELQPVAQLRYEFETHDATPKYKIDELSEKQIELLKQVIIDPQKLLTADQRARVDETLKRMVAAFAENPKSPHLTHVLEARVEFKEGMEPAKHRAGRKGDAEMSLIDEHVKSLQANDQIEPGNGPYAARLVLVSKKDETQPSGKSTRLCVDFRDTNACLATQGQDLPLPRCDDVLC